MTKFYYQHYDNQRYNSINAQQMYKEFPPTFEETEHKWKMKLFKSRDLKLQNWKWMKWRKWKLR